MNTVTIIFKNPAHTTTKYLNVLKAEVHTYNYLELIFSDNSSEQFNLNDIFSFKVQ